MPVFPLLGLLFVYLKLTHVIAWSWLYVTMPFWILFAIVIALLIFGGSVVGLISLLTRKKKKAPQARRSFRIA